MYEMLKDNKLEYIYRELKGNIARYISITPNMEIRYINISVDNNYSENLRECITNLITISKTKSVNIRSFSTECMKGNELIYGKKIDNIDEIINLIETNCKNNKYSIVNETIDVNDGGVSGVVFGNIVEFAPNDTPKCVEKPDVCFLGKDMGFSILKTVYGFLPEINFDDECRVEFSLHPQREGILNEHTVIWEYEVYDKFKYDTRIQWPNRFSKFIGDKTFGLIVADYLGFNVPYTVVLSRNVPPFSFGKSTGIYEKWIRTAPAVKEPGKFYTSDKWTDPFKLMNSEELKGDNDINIASILSQSAVESTYSGGAIISQTGDEDIIEGVEGKGDDFMLGTKQGSALPNDVVEKLKIVMDELRKYNSIIGNVSIEWVYDGEKIWIVQLNQIKHIGEGKVIVPGNPSRYERFFVNLGLDKLRIKIEEIKDKNLGIELVGNVGVCSHFGDILRKSNIPSFISN